MAQFVFPWPFPDKKEIYKVTAFNGEGDVLSLSDDDADECVQIARSTPLRRLSPRARFDQAPLNLGQILCLVSYSTVRELAEYILI